MIVVDSSALIAVVKREPEAELCLAALITEEEIFISAATWTELHIVASQKLLLWGLRTLLAALPLRVIELDHASAQLAAEAYYSWGRRNHPAELNYGDCFAYALAKSLNCPLLYIGNDFAQTDIVSALAQTPHG